jgi:hypothetical protein
MQRSAVNGRNWAICRRLRRKAARRPSTRCLKGEQVTLSDALIVFHRDAPQSEAHSARLFLQMLGSAYRLLDKPDFEFHDWPERAERTLRDLAKAPAATISHYGNLYVHPYTDAEYPDSMVQVSLLTSIHDTASGSASRFRSKPVWRAGWIASSIPRSDRSAVICPMSATTRTRMRSTAGISTIRCSGLGGSRWMATSARRLFEKSIGFAIKAAHHFKYKWPIQYKVTDFSVITEARGDTELGQTDVGGIYAYVMLVAFELTDDPKFLLEARKAIDAAQGMRFELNYQANLTAWGAAACMRLWRITNEGPLSRPELCLSRELLPQ